MKIQTTGDKAMSISRDVPRARTRRTSASVAKQQRMSRPKTPVETAAGADYKIPSADDGEGRDNARSRS
jgi:hypothetical protein